MNLSFNEVEALAKHATRGAGYSWGQAEDAAKATRWLCSNSANGVGILAYALSLKLADANHKPNVSTNHWSGADTLCPIATGTALSDYAEKLRTEAIEIDKVAVPAMLLPFAANISLQLGMNVTLETSDWTATTDGTLVSGIPEFTHAPQSVFLLAGGHLSHPIPQKTRAICQPLCWENLKCLAMSTYAPATEESRRLGAG